MYIGISEDRATRDHLWSGFNIPEDANGHIQAFEQLFPLGEGYGYTFLTTATDVGYVLKVEVAKSLAVKTASDGIVYVRRGAQNLPVSTEEALTRLRRNKGLVSFEIEPVSADKNLITIRSSHLNSCLKSFQRLNRRHGYGSSNLSMERNLR